MQFLTLFVTLAHAQFPSHNGVPDACIKLVSPELHRLRLNNVRPETLEGANYISYTLNETAVEIRKNQSGYTVIETHAKDHAGLWLNSKCEVVSVISPTQKTLKKPECDAYAAAIKDVRDRQDDLIMLEREKASKTTLEDDGEYKSQLRGQKFSLKEVQKALTKLDKLYYGKRSPDKSVISLSELCKISPWGSADAENQTDPQKTKDAPNAK